jgi:hypothetical protein
MAKEDLTTYTKTDANGRLTVTASEVTAASLQLNDPSATRITKDFGDGYFNETSIALRHLQTNIDSATGSIAGTRISANADSDGAGNSNDVTFGINDDGAGTKQRVFAMQGNFSGFVTNDTTEEGNTLWFLFTKAAGESTAVLYFYSDSGYKTLIGSLSVGSPSSYRCVQPFKQYYQNLTKRLNYYVGDVYLDGIPTSGVARNKVVYPSARSWRGWR